MRYFTVLKICILLRNKEIVITYEMKMEIDVKIDIDNYVKEFWKLSGRGKQIFI